MTQYLKETARGVMHVRAEDDLFTNREIFFTDAVDSKSSAQLIKQLLFLDRQNNNEITLYINSPGGEVPCGLAVYDCIMTLKSPVTTVCIGTAASMGAILFLAGSRRKMYPHTRLMIHDPSYISNNINGKKPAEIENVLNSLNVTRDELAGIISERTGKSLKKVLKLTAKDTFFTAYDALDFGLATEIIGRKNIYER